MLYNCDFVVTILIGARLLGHTVSHLLGNKNNRHIFKQRSYFYNSLCPSVDLLVCLPVCLFVCLSVCLFVCFFVCLFFFVFLFVCLFYPLLYGQFILVYICILNFLNVQNYMLKQLIHGPDMFLRIIDSTSTA